MEGRPADRAFRGVILGTAVGDALGLPYEGMAPGRAGRLLPPPLRPRLLFGRSMISDDTEHTLLVAQALLRHPRDDRAFARSLAWGLRGWLLAVPAGVGFATLRAGLKLCLGFPPDRSGVWSAGNGPAMRSAVLGVFLGDDPERLRRYVRASTRLTHTDPRAERGALAVALAACHARHHGAAGCLGYLREALAGEEDPELVEVLDAVEAACRPGASFDAGARGVSGYVYRTLAAALAAWLRHPDDYRACLEECVSWGGDTDTAGAIAGALAGAAVGEDGIPSEWLASLWEWPRSVTWMRRVADRLGQVEAGEASAGAVPLAWPLIPLRNALFVGVILAHGFRRLAPPY